MRRKLTLLGGVVSLLLCLATAGLWIHGIWYSDEVIYRADKWIVSAESNDHTFSFSHFSFPNGVATALRGFDFESQPPMFNVSTFSWKTLGFFAGSMAPRENGVPQPIHFVNIPHWFVVLLFSIFPACLMARKIKSRISAGLCTVCGYDLRASPGVCPECGNGRRDSGK
jgi:hypothetical protein